MKSYAFVALLSVLLTCFWGAAARVTADETGGGRAFFESKIRPVLVAHCYECHAVDAAKIGGRLLLDTPSALRLGGESGSPIREGDAEESLLIHAMRGEDDLEMPPKKLLPPAVVGDFITWINMGAPDPREDDPSKLPSPPDPAEVAKTHWSFQPVGDPAPPTPGDENWPLAPLDRFVLAGIAEAGLIPAEPAPPATLLRRLAIDLTGLPPTVAETEEFLEAVARHGQEAVADAVDAFLSSPRFGERWGRHWLDVARYGESNGNDGLSRNPTFPHAWRYRDYVIDALNRDLPYDQFITEQIAGDILAGEIEEHGDLEERDRLLVATGFLALGAKPAKAMNVNFDMDVVDDQIAVVTTGLMGLSVACARCHDHKHDPVPTRDYYAMAGIFTSTETMWGLAANEKLTAPATDLHVLQAAPKVLPPDDFVETVVVLDSNTGKPKAGPKPRWAPGTPLAMGVRDKKEPGDCQIHLKGESKSLGESVPRGFLSAWQPSDAPFEIPSEASGRLELAQWITHPDNPLASRVMVNRIWLHLFGQALVGTPDDFGLYGDRPTHPELLDHLATRFMAEGWSIKRIVRDIVLSRTYQLDSASDARSLEKDPGNVHLARHLRRRLDAESLRDAMLKASGELDLTPAEGSLVRHRDILVNRAGNLHEASRHRSLYLCMLRHSPPPELAAFDFPDGLGVTGRRSVTVLPAQALYLINSPFLVEQSEAFARSLWREIPGSGADAARAELAIRRAFGRNPRSGESERGLSLIRDLEVELASDFPDPETRRERSWAAWCQALLATNEFRYVD